MKRMNPLVVISLGLMSLTVSVMLVGDMLVDLAPDQGKQEVVYRRTLAEALAVQYSKLAERGDSLTIKMALQMLVARNDDILSAALRTVDGLTLAKAGDHEGEWVQPPGEQSTVNHIQVPIFAGDAPWGILQVTFRPSFAVGLWGVVTNPWIHFMTFVAVLGFLAYLLFMKKTLRQLDPSSMIPPRVKAALDVLAEGIVVLDPRGYIVLANAAFGERLGQEPATIVGLALSELGWKSPQAGTDIEVHPWTAAVRDGTRQPGVRLSLSGPTGDVKTFIAHSGPLLDEKGSVRGVLTSFSDVTQLDQTNAHLTTVVKDLEASQAEVIRQNAELGRVATRDSLTGCLNRRAFFAKVETVFAGARLEGTALSCIMVDIDHFKSVNDQYGHAVGDQAINAVARALGGGLRPTDILGRYGGEEFCIMLIGQEADQAAKVAERLRSRIESASSTAIPSIPGIRITASLGVSSIASGAPDPLELIDQADKALYDAKERGRNRVRCWGEDSSPEDPSVLQVLPGGRIAL